MGKERLFQLFISDLSRLRDGDWAAADFLNNVFLSDVGLELHSRAIVGSAKVRRVLDIRRSWYLREGFLSQLDSHLRLVNAIQTSLNDWLESGRQTLLYSLLQTCMDGDWEINPPQEPSGASIPSYAVVVSAVILLSLVYQYLTGNADRGGSRAYSRSSLDFRDVYIAIVLFLGAYVWIKFREVAFKGVHPRKLMDKQGGIKVVYAARLTPPLWNGKKLPRLDLGQFATPQEAHNKFLIAAFYYNRGAGLLDGWFQVPPMNEKERSLVGLEKRKWVISQAKKVYEDFKKKEAEAKEKEEATSMVRELLEVWDDQLLPEQYEVNVDFSLPNFLNSTEHQQPIFADQVENFGMDMAMLDCHGLECTSHSFDGMHEGIVLSNSHSCQEANALPVSQLALDTKSGMNLNNSDQLESLQTLVCTQQQHISLQQQQIFYQHQQIQRFAAQILQLQRQQCIQQQQLHEFRMQSPQWLCQFCLQQQLLQDINNGVPSLEVEMENMHQQNYSGFMTLPPDGEEG